MKDIFFAFVMLMIVTYVKLCSLTQWLSFIEQRNMWWKKDAYDEKIEYDYIK